MRRSVMRKPQVPISKVKVTLTHQRSNSKMTLSGAFFLHAWKDFNLTWHNCSPSWDGVSCARTRSLGQRSRSHLAVKGYKNDSLSGAFLFHVWRDCDVTWHKCSPPWEGVSCAKTRSKVKVTVRGQKSDTKMTLSWAFLFDELRDFDVIWKIVHQNVMECHVQDPRITSLCCYYK